MKKLVCSVIIAGFCFFGIGAVTALAGGLSQDPQAQAFLGSYEASIMAMSAQRDWEITISAIDDNGKVTVGRYHLGSTPSQREEDVNVEEAIFKRDEKGPAIFITVPGGIKKILRLEKGGLSCETIGGRTPGMYHLKKK